MKAHTAEIVRTMEKENKPLVITQNGGTIELLLQGGVYGGVATN